MAFLSGNKTLMFCVSKNLKKIENINFRLRLERKCDTLDYLSKKNMKTSILLNKKRKLLKEHKNETNEVFRKF